MSYTFDIENALLEDIESTVETNTITDWIKSNRTVKGKPWQWVSREPRMTKDFRYLIPIYEDDADVIIVKKSRQMAISEYGINWVMYHTSKYPHLTALHIFPNQDQAKKFSMVRLTPIFDKKDSPKLARLLKEPEQKYGASLQAAMNVYHKQFVNLSNYILSFVGGVNAKSTDARSISADIIFLDESKDLPQEKINDVIECMSLSSHRKMRMVGTPDFEDTEFDRRFKMSDQREWIATCPVCGLAQPITFGESIMSTKSSPHLNITSREDEYYYGCTGCQSELNRTADFCKWIPQNPESKIHGYHLSQLMASWISADEIMMKKANSVKFPHTFPNEVLGETFAGGASPITISKLLNGRVDDGTVFNTFKYVTLGVDWGDQSHYTILGANDRSTGRYILEKGTLSNPRVLDQSFEVAHKMDIWRPNLSIVDSGYGKAQNQALFQAYPSEVYACFYKDSAFVPLYQQVDEINGEMVGKDDIQYHVSINHSALCDSLMAQIDAHQLKIPIRDDDDLVSGLSETKDFMDNMCLAKAITTDNGTKKKRTWIITKAHHFASTAYANLAMDSLLEDDSQDGAADFFEPRKYR